MGTGRRIILPLLSELRGPRADPGPPRMDSARRQLGGRASTRPGPGRLVELDSVGGGTLDGVVLFESETEVDVWIDGGMVRRLRPDRVRAHTGQVPVHLAAVALDAAVFARLTEGQRVAWQDPDGTSQEGLMLEKCRYGGLVARDDGSLVALGFRKLLPAGTGQRPS